MASGAGASAGLPVRVEYILQARASGVVWFSSAIAAINDPFELDGDPVQGGLPFGLEQVPVPLPPALAAFGPGVLLLGARRRCAQHPGSGTRPGAAVATPAAGSPLTRAAAADNPG